MTLWYPWITPLLLLLHSVFFICHLYFHLFLDWSWFMNKPSSVQLHPNVSDCLLDLLKIHYVTSWILLWLGYTLCSYPSWNSIILCLSESCNGFSWNCRQHLGQLQKSIMIATLLDTPTMVTAYPQRHIHSALSMLALFYHNDLEPLQNARLFSLNEQTCWTQHYNVSCYHQRSLEWSGRCLVVCTFLCPLNMQVGTQAGQYARSIPIWCPLGRSSTRPRNKREIIPNDHQKGWCTLCSQRGNRLFTVLSIIRQVSIISWQKIIFWSQKYWIHYDIEGTGSQVGWGKWSRQAPPLFVAEWWFRRVQFEFTLPLDLPWRMLPLLFVRSGYGPDQHLSSESS